MGTTNPPKCLLTIFRSACSDSTSNDHDRSRSQGVDTGQPERDCGKKPGAIGFLDTESCRISSLRLFTRREPSAAPGNERGRNTDTLEHRDNGRAKARKATNSRPSGFSARTPKRYAFVQLVSGYTNSVEAFASLSGESYSLAQDVACSAVITTGGRMEWAGVPGSFCVPSLCAAPCGRWDAAASMVVNGQVRTCPSMEKTGFGGRACWSYATGSTLSFLAELVELASGFLCAGSAGT